MGFTRKIVATLLLAALVTPAQALNILLTNDDGWDSPGIQIMRSALIDAGHTVTLVAPLNEQSGKGGGLSTDFGASIAVVQQSPGVWNVDSTPSDCIRAAVGGIINPEDIDMVISGINSGQNLGITGTQQSGTINAALGAMHHGMPAIAVSAERFANEQATIDAMPNTADFIVRLLARLDQYKTGGELLAPGYILNVNYPVLLDEGRTSPIATRVVNLASKSNIEFVWSGDPATTGTMSVGIDFGQITPPAIPDPVINNDTDMLRDDYVTVSVLNGDMTVKNQSSFASAITAWILYGLAP